MTINTNTIRNAAKEAAIVEINANGLSNATLIGGSYFLNVDVQVDEQGTMETRFVEIALTVKQSKDTKRSAAFTLEGQVAKVEQTLVEKEQEKARKKAEREAAKAAKEEENADA